MAYTLGEATKATGVSKTSLHRAIKSGRISATKNDLGAWEIDPAELHRVFPPASVRNSSESLDLARDGTANGTTVLRRELELLREERERERGQFEREIERLEQQLQASEQERRDKDRQLTALLTDQRPHSPDVLVTPPPAANGQSQPQKPDPAPAKRRWRLFGGRG